MSVRLLPTPELVGLLIGNRVLVEVYDEFGLTVPDATRNQIREAETELTLRAQAEKQAKVTRLQARLQGLKTRGEVRAELEEELKALLAK